MKRMLLGIVCALALGASADATVRTVVAKDGAEPAGYVPAMLSNGRLNVFMPYRHKRDLNLRISV